MNERVKNAVGALEESFCLKVYTALLQHKLSLHELTDLFEVSREKITRSLDRLESSGLLQSEENGRYKYYQAASHPIEEVCRRVLENNEKDDTWNTLNRGIQSLKTRPSYSDEPFEVVTTGNRISTH